MSTQTKHQTILDQCVEGTCITDTHGTTHYLATKTINDMLRFNNETYYYHGTSDGRAFYSHYTPKQLKQLSDEYHSKDNHP